jgi:hypothetical protein
MAVPRLRDERCFYELDPAEIDDIEAAPAISNVADHARQVGPEAVGSVDLVVSGSVAVTEDGTRIGKGEGYSDLEYAVLRELGLVDGTTPVVTTVHELQIVGGSEGVVDTTVPVDDHDVPMDWVVTPARTMSFGIRTMVVGSLLTIVGYQVASLGVFATVASDPIRRPTDRITTGLVERLSLELGATVGVVVFAFGVGYAGYLLLRWFAGGYEALPVLTHDILAFTAIVLGVQTVFGSFFMSAVGERE